MGNIVFVGAGGTGMSGLVMMLHDLGYHNLIAIDASESLLMTKIKAKGIQTFIGHGKYAVQRDDVVIYSDIPAIIDGPELSASRIYQQTPTKKYFHITLSYNQFVAEISKRFVTIAVAGSNGKTSTTGMLIYTLAESGNAEMLKCGATEISKNGNTEQLKKAFEPLSLGAFELFGLGIVGGLMPNFDQQGYAINTSIQSDIKHLFDHIFNQKHQLDYSLLKKYLFVIEACEYKEHFLMYDTDYALITNIQRDHTDYFTTIDHYCETFLKFLYKTKRKAILTQSAYNTLESQYEAEAESNKLQAEAEAYGIRSQLKAEEKIIISQDYAFNNPNLIGKYYESNAGMIYKLLEKLCYHETMKLGDLLSNRKGMGRRMELIGRNGNGAPIYSDYSHHAPAIAGNLEAIKKQFPNKKIVVIFQPHQAQRVLVGRDDFTYALTLADDIIIYKLYTARENFDEMKKDHNELKDLNSFDELGEKFADHVAGNYITDMDILSNTINQYDDNTIIVYFSAGDLDQNMREKIK